MHGRRLPECELMENGFAEYLIQIERSYDLGFIPNHVCTLDQAQTPCNLKQD